MLRRWLLLNLLGSLAHMPRRPLGAAPNAEQMEKPAPQSVDGLAALLTPTARPLERPNPSGRRCCQRLLLRQRQNYLAAGLGHPTRELLADDLLLLALVPIDHGLHPRVALQLLLLIRAFPECSAHDVALLCQSVHLVLEIFGSLLRQSALLPLLTEAADQLLPVHIGGARPRRQASQGGAALVSGCRLQVDGLGALPWPPKEGCGGRGRGRSRRGAR
mmetsp:Transcript_7273/g.20645  ORF Transcript_7273/g.20645 Transcript_7273/m.20645 type:complete len:218 (-) Transcript_7273:103-756(-)